MRTRDARWVPYWLVFVAAVVVAVLWWSASDADDAMQATREQTRAGWVLSTPDTTPGGNTSAQASVRNERNRRYEVERLLRDTTRALSTCRVMLATSEALYGPLGARE